MLIVDKFFVETVENFCYNTDMDEKYLYSLVSGAFGAEFEAFRELLKEYNSRFNLTAVCDDEGIFHKHFVDSIAPMEFFDENARVVEIGSGAGFPSLPLKIVRKDLNFTLIESTGKKCEFLKTACARLNLSGVEVLNIRAEDGARRADLREKFDICCARAVAALNTLSEYCLPYVRVGGKFIAYKGDCDGELKDARRAIELLGGEVERVEKYSLEKCGLRTAVVIKKVCATPSKYPRGQGKERKSPL